jgi:hypothetical protein
VAAAVALLIGLASNKGCEKEPVKQKGYLEKIEK